MPAPNDKSDTDAPSDSSPPDEHVQRTAPAKQPLGAKERRSFFTRVALAGSNELRSHLPLDEVNYLRLALEAQSDARAYYMYSVLDTVYKAGVAMIRWEDVLGDEDHLPDESQSTSLVRSIEDRLVNASLVSEASVWIRQLLETLAALISFSTTNEDKYYRHRLLVHQLDTLNYTRKDHREYFACENKGLAHRIDETIATIRALEPSINFTQCWYLQDKRALSATPRTGLLSSFGTILRFVVPLARPREKAELGLSYQQFSRVSESIHFSPGNRWFERSSEDLAAYFSYCSLLVQSILIRVIELTASAPTGLCATLVKVYDENRAPDELSQRLTSGRAKVGDFVIVGRGLARVTAVKPTGYGYESYAIRYLADAPGPNVTEDDVLPYHLHRVQETTKLKALTRDRMKTHAPSSTLTDEQREHNLESAIEDSMREAWEHGMRDAFLRANVRRK